jgi:hypothetical protein
MIKSSSSSEKCCSSTADKSPLVHLTLENVVR